MKGTFVRTNLVLSITTCVLVLAPLVHADEWPPQAADSDVGKRAIKNFDVTLAAFGKKDLEPLQLLAATKAGWDCGVAYNDLLSLTKSSYDSSRFYDENKQMMPTSAGSITLKELGE